MPVEPDSDSILKELDLDKTNDQVENISPMKNKQMKLLVVFAVIAVIAGVGTGYAGYKVIGGGPSSGQKGAQIQPAAEGQIKVGDTFGILDDETFKDSAEGYLEEAGPEDEGSHVLLRPGGPSQTVHLTSSATDLSKFIGMEIKVQGETFKGQKAGWLMDVGKVEVLATDGEEPSEF